MHVLLECYYIKMKNASHWEKLNILFCRNVWFLNSRHCQFLRVGIICYHFRCSLKPITTSIDDTSFHSYDGPSQLTYPDFQYHNALHQNTCYVVSPVFCVLLHLFSTALLQDKNRVAILKLNIFFCKFTILVFTIPYRRSMTRFIGPLSHSISMWLVWWC